MRNYSLLAIMGAALLLSACNNARINGTLNGVSNSDVIIKMLDVNKLTPLDTIRTSKNGAYSYKAHIAKGQPEFIYIYYKDIKVASMLLERGDKVKVVSDTMGHYSVTGSPETEKLMSVERDESDFLNSFSSNSARLDDLPDGSQESMALRREMAKQYISYYRGRVQYIMSNPYSLTIIPVLYQNVGSMPVFSQATDAILFKNACDSLKSVYPLSKYVKALEEETERRFNLLNLSAKFTFAKEITFPELELPDINGKKIKLSECDSKLIAIYFWTAAVAEQKMFNLDLLKPVYEKYHSKGLEIFAVSLDTDKNIWANVVKSQNLPWINVCDGLGAASVAARVYNVSQIPMVYFIKDGQLLADVGVRDGKSLKKYIEKNLK